MTTASEPLDLDAIQARADAATKGPWRAEPGALVTVHAPERGSIGDAESLSVTSDHVTSAYGVVPHGIISREDAVFVAAAREDIPALVAEARTLWELVAKLEAERQAIRDLHMPVPYGTSGQQRYHCRRHDTSEFTIDWPCDEAKIVYTPEEITQIKKGTP